MNKIAAIITTFNRKDCLIECLEAICWQTLSPDVIYIIDNNSSDGTMDLLVNKGYIYSIPGGDVKGDYVSTFKIKSHLTNCDILITYVYKSLNTGGAGGFYTGMKLAYDDGYEWLWMMDDDGVPVNDSLEQLYNTSVKYNMYFANALVISNDDKFSLSFNMESGKNNISDYKDIDVLYGKINPFNGSFINRIVPEKIGFIKKEMFIWGDEREYYERALKNQFRIGTIIKSIHYHPKGRGGAVKVFPIISKIRVVIKPPEMSYYFYRNIGYIYWNYRRRKFYYMFICYILYFSIRLKFSECRKYVIAYINGCRNNFNVLNDI